MKNTFHITASPSRRLFPCQTMIDEQRRGLFGFHNSDKCADCRHEDHGWELWGENGHMQGTIKPDQDLTEMLALRKRLDPSLEFTVSDHTITWMR